MSWGNSHLLARGNKPQKGSILLNGTEVESYSDMLSGGTKVGRIPDDRQRYGLVMDMSVEDNLMLINGPSEPYAQCGMRKTGLWHKKATELIEAFDVRTSGVAARARSLSGGNQQKVILAREFSDSPHLLLVTNPTRGLDMGAIEMIHKRLVAAAKGGCAVLLISSDLDEVLSLSNRVVVMHSGSFMGEAKGPKYDISKIGLWMAGEKGEKSA